MANRFTRISPVLYNSPQFVSEPIVPDFNAMHKVLASKQAELQSIQAAGAKVPKHTQADTADVMNFMANRQAQIDELADLYASGEYDKVSPVRDEFIQQTVRDFQPGGQAHSFEANATARQAYHKQVDQALAKGTINSERAKLLKQFSDNRFGSTAFDKATGNFNNFQGLDPAKNVAIDDIALDRAKGWKASKISKGFKLMPNGEFYSEKTKEFVSAQEVYDNIASSLINDEEVVADIRQYAQLNGLNFQQVLSSEVDRAAKLAAAKEGFVVEETKNVRANKALAHSRAKKLIDYQMKVEEANSSLRISGGNLVIKNPMGGTVNSTLQAQKAGQMTAKNSLKTFTTLYKDKHGRIVEAIADWSEKNNIRVDDFHDPEVWLKAYQSGVFANVEDNDGNSFAKNKHFQTMIDDITTSLLHAQMAENRIRTAYQKEFGEKKAFGPEFEQYMDDLNARGRKVDQITMDLPSTEAFGVTENRVAEMIMNGGHMTVKPVSSGFGQVSNDEYWVTLTDENGKNIKTTKVKGWDEASKYLATTRELKILSNSSDNVSNKINQHLSDNIITPVQSQTELMTVDGETQKQLSKEFNAVVTNAGVMMQDILPKSVIQGPAEQIISDGKYNASNITVRYIPALDEWQHVVTVSDGEKSATVAIPSSVVSTKGLDRFKNSNQGKTSKLLSTVSTMDAGQTVNIPGLDGVNITKTNDGINRYEIHGPLGSQVGPLNELKDILDDMFNTQQLESLGLSSEMIQIKDQLEVEHHIDPTRNVGNVSAFHRDLKAAGFEEYQIHALYPHMIQKPR